MAARHAVDTLRLETAAVDAGRVSGVGEGFVDGFLPQSPQAFGAAFFRELGDARAGVDVAVPNDDVHMRVVAVLAPVVDHGQPRGAASGDFAQINADEGLPVRGREFER